MLHSKWTQTDGELQHRLRARVNHERGESGIQIAKQEFCVNWLKHKKLHRLLSSCYMWRVDKRVNLCKTRLIVSKLVSSLDCQDSGNIRNKAALCFPLCTKETERKGGGGNVLFTKQNRTKRLCHSPVVTFLQASIVLVFSCSSLDMDLAEEGNWGTLSSNDSDVVSSLNYGSCSYGDAEADDQL